MLGVTALGRDIPDARRRVYDAIQHVNFPGMHFRKDVAADVNGDIVKNGTTRA